MSGVLAGLPLTATLDGDDSLRRRPVARIIEPLRSMGAALHARRNDSLPPLTVVGRTPLRAIDYTTPVPSAQVKSAILLAGLRAEGRTTVREVGRDARSHGADAAGTRRAGRADRRAGRVGGLDGTRRGGGAARSRNGSRATSRRRRSGWSRAPSTPTPSSASATSGSTRRAGPSSTSCARWAPTSRSGRTATDPRRRRRRADRRPASSARRRSTASTSARPTSPPRSTRSRSSAWRPRWRPARPSSAAPASCATRNRTGSPGSRPACGRSAPGSRSTATTSTSRAARSLRGAETDSLDDHRLAMTFAIAGLVATGQTSIGRPRSAAISYPGFFDDLERVRA